MNDQQTGIQFDLPVNLTCLFQSPSSGEEHNASGHCQLLMHGRAILQEIIFYFGQDAILKERWVERSNTLLCFAVMDHQWNVHLLQKKEWSTNRHSELIEDLEQIAAYNLL